MSSRRPSDSIAANDYADRVRAEIEGLKASAKMANESFEGSTTPTSNDVSETVEDDTAGQLVFEDLSQTERACASLGAPADALRPIGWLNAGHYDALKSSNSLDPELARRLEAYKAVAERSA